MYYVNISYRIYNFNISQFSYVDFLTFLYGNNPLWFNDIRFRYTIRYELVKIFNDNIVL